MPFSAPSLSCTNPPLQLAIELSAVIVAVQNGVPCVLTDSTRALPSGPFETQHRTLEQGLRAWAHAGAGITLGYVEQLYTFADKDRGPAGSRSVSIGYLALHRPQPDVHLQSATDWYAFFPWEDRRAGPPACLAAIAKGLQTWKNDAPSPDLRRQRAKRIAFAFPAAAKDWNDEMVLQRYELLWEAGLIAESRAHTSPAPPSCPLPGLAMPGDHRRILATAMARLRAKIKYRPVVFELMPDRFTLLQLQTTVEALAGLRLHKQNFRRLVQREGLVEAVRGTLRDTRGRPAKLFTFRKSVLEDRAAAGTKLPRMG